MCASEQDDVTRMSTRCEGQRIARRANEEYRPDLGSPLHNYFLAALFRDCVDDFTASTNYQFRTDTLKDGAADRLQPLYVTSVFDKEALGDGSDRPGCR